MDMTVNERLLRHDQEGVIQEEAKQPPRRTPAPEVQFFIYGPRLPWVDETKLKGVRPEDAFEKVQG
jgi:hypothetical protein